MSISRTLLTVMALSLLVACRHPGPAAAPGVSSPDSPVLIDPILLGHVGIPETQPSVRTSTADGRLRLAFHLQNQTEKELHLEHEATFYDADGVPVYRAGPRSIFLPPQSIEAVETTSASEEAKSVVVQVRPAR